MFRLESEQALLKTFRPRDRRALEIPKELTFPLFVRDYLAWADPAGVYTYLVFGGAKAGKGSVATGIAFRRDQSAGAGARLCEWCHSHGTGEAIGLLTTDLNSKRRVGITLCLDLSCQRKLEDEANRSGRSLADRLAAMNERMARFAREALHIDLSGAGRD